MKLMYSVLFMALPLITYAQQPQRNAPRNERPALAFKMYPNPASGKTITILTDSSAPKEIAIYDVFGERLISETLNSNTLDISSLVPGVYVIQLIQDQHRLTRKLVVK